MLKTGFTAIILVLISLVELVLVSRFFDITTFTFYAQFLLVTSLLNLFGGGVVSQYHLRRNSLVKPSLFYLMIFLSGTQALIYKYISLFSFVPEVHFLVVFLHLFLLLAIASMDSLNIRKKEIQLSNVAYLLSSSIALSVIILAIYNKYQVFYILVFSLVLKNTLALFFMKGIRVFKFKVDNVKRLILYYLSLMAFYHHFVFSSILGYISLSMDKWCVNLISMGNFAYYTRTIQLLNVPIIFFNRMLAKDVQSMMLNNQNYQGVLGKLLIASLLVSTIMFFSSHFFISIILGKEWLAVALYLQILSFLIPVRVMVKYIDVHVRAYHSPRSYRNLHLINAISIVLAILTGYFIPLFLGVDFDIKFLLYSVITGWFIAAIISSYVFLRK